MSLPAIFSVEGVVRRYEWGSRTAIQQLLGHRPDGRPAAELWFGAHEDDPSPALGTTLDRLVAAHPQTLLGASGADARLPFLVKVLAAEQALSLQVHPSREQAERGFEREERTGVPREAAERVFKDANHKPELMCALHAFDALCGFRPVRRSLELLTELDVPELAPLMASLRGADPLRAAMTTALTDGLGAAKAVTRRLGGITDGPLRGAALAATDAPDDPGVLIALLLNYLRLEPGEAVFLAAGTVHAYLRGTGVEVMANSDNVVRGGLTRKHVDVPQLLAMTDFVDCPDPRVTPQPAGPGRLRYPVPVPDFAVERVTVANAETVQLSPPAGPTLLLCVSGRPLATAGADGLQLAPGHAALVTPVQEPIRLDGAGDVFVTSSGAPAKT